MEDPTSTSRIKLNGNGKRISRIRNRSSQALTSTPLRVCGLFSSYNPFSDDEKSDENNNETDEALKNVPK